MDYLKRAQDYAFEHGDNWYFHEIYVRLREHNGVKASVWKALAFIYTDEVANSLIS
jgi:hypothetical protein